MGIHKFTLFWCGNHGYRVLIRPLSLDLVLSGMVVHLTLFFASNLLLVKKRKVYFLCYIGMPGSRVGLDQPILGDGHQCILIRIYVPTMFGCPWNGMDDHKPYTVTLSYVTWLDPSTYIFTPSGRYSFYQMTVFSCWQTHIRYSLVKSCEIHSCCWFNPRYINPVKVSFNSIQVSCHSMMLP